tara:strand:+ start:1149 stop:1718 length:570 start_codon:yes stop_codon:yes gene_type:complete
MTKTTEQLMEELTTLRSEYKKLGDKVLRKYNQWEKSAKSDNQSKVGSIEWLVNNPDTPAQYEGMKDWMVKNLGGEYNGVNASGYYQHINQQAFNFTLGYGDGRNGEYDETIKKFVNLVLPFLKPRQDNLVVFNYATGQHSGIKQIAWDVKKEVWTTFETCHSRDSNFNTWESLDDALDYAWKISLSIDD